MIRDEINKLNIHSEILVEGGKEKAFEVPKGKYVTFIDAEGQQVVDFLAFTGSETGSPKPISEHTCFTDYE